MTRRVDVKGLIVDPISHLPIVVLKDQGSEDVLPIWIGEYEGEAIMRGLDAVTTPRPMTHDLLSSMVNSLEGRVGHIVIHDFVDHTFFAKIVLDCRGQSVEVDSRPSDAIALALRASCPILVEDAVFANAGSQPASEADAREEIAKWLAVGEPAGEYDM